MMMFETSKHVPKTEKRCCVFENNHFHFRIYWGISDKCLVSTIDLYCVTLCMCALVFVAVSEVQMSRQTKLEIA